jgi:hypothetical protein
MAPSALFALNGAVPGLNCELIFDSSGRHLMKAIAAALIAAVILYAVDTQYNDGRYTQVLAQAMTSVISR